MKRIVKPIKIRFCYFVFVSIVLFTFLVNNAKGQKVTVTGVVADNEGHPVSGAVVREAGQSLATFTEADGAFIFSVSGVPTTLNVSKQGYHPVEVTITNFAEVKMILTKLEELRDSLFANVPFEDYLWSENNISSPVVNQNVNFFKRDGARLMYILNSIPGVDVHTNDGSPAGQYSVNIRGEKSLTKDEPLFILDGTVLNAGITRPDQITFTDPLILVNPTDIKSITVLKDASATAIYGAKGANGVVLIKTKEGCEPFQFKIYAQTGLLSPFYENQMLDQNQYIDLINESVVASGKEPLTLVSGQYRDWRNEILRTGNRNNLGIEMSGKGNKSGFYLSGHLNQKTGVLNNSNILSGSSLLNVSTTLGSWLDISGNFNYSTTRRFTPLSDENQMMANPYVFAQIFPPFNENEFRTESSYENYFGLKNPEDWFNLIKNESRENSFAGNVNFSVRFGDFLSISVKTSGDYSKFSRNLNAPQVGNNSYFGMPEVQKQEGRIYNWDVTSLLKYENRTGNHHWLFLFGESESFLKGVDSVFISRSNNFLTENNYSLLSATNLLIGKNSQRTGALFIQGNYAFNNRFDLSVGLRRENILHQLGVNMFGLFPSFSSGFWLFQNSESRAVFSGIKLKTGWGIVGADAFNALRYNELNTLVDADLLPGITPGSNNPNIRWEHSETWNFGAEAHLFNHSVRINFDYFDDLRTDVAFINQNILKNEIVPQWVNSGRIHYSGWEFSSNYARSIDQFDFNLSLNFLKIKNKFLGFSENQTAASENFVTATFRGVPVAGLSPGGRSDAFLGFVEEGIFQTDEEVNEANLLSGIPNEWYQSEWTAPGDIRFKDIDNNGVIDEKDITVIGHSSPGFTYGILFQMKYLGFDATVQMDGAADFQVFNLNKVWENATGGLGNRSRSMLNRWTVAYSDNQCPRVKIDDPNRNNRPHSGMIENGNYFRFSDIEFGYSFRNSSGNCFRPYLSVQNLLISSYSGGNPVVGGGNSFNGIDFGRFPQSVTLLAGIQINLQ